jgi:hypothetical protein
MRRSLLLLALVGLAVPARADDAAAEAFSAFATKIRSVSPQPLATAVERPREASKRIDPLPDPLDVPSPQPKADGCLCGEKCQCKLPPEVSPKPAETPVKRETPTARGRVVNGTYYLLAADGVEYYGPDWPSLWQHVQAVNAGRAAPAVARPAPTSTPRYNYPPPSS